jgi:CRISPR/Cas system-associated exonuclease Cas4 (RecB family)
MKITGTLIKNFFHCSRQAYLYYYGLNFKNEIIKIGEIMHQEQKPKEYLFEKIRVDDIKGDCLIEYKKTSSNIDGTKMQVLYYLDFFNSKGIKLKGLIKDLTYNNEYIIELNNENKLNLEQTFNNINKLLNEKSPPSKKNTKKECKNCSFLDYCWVE